MNTSQIQLKEAVTLLGPKLVLLRRAFHRMPELSGAEATTAGTIERYLTDLGLSVQTEIAGHGLSASVLCHAQPRHRPFAKRYEARSA